MFPILVSLRENPYFTILSDVQNDRNDLAGVMIDGVPVRKGC
jgi:hypothetical protein